MIKFRNENENSAGNFNSITIQGVRFWFSYETCVAVSLRLSFKGSYVFVIQNCRGPTTGKHLNWISTDKDTRIDRDAFDEVLQEAYRQIGIVT